MNAKVGGGSWFGWRPGETTFGALATGDHFRMPSDSENAILEKIGPGRYKVIGEGHAARGCKFPLQKEVNVVKVEKTS